MNGKRKNLRRFWAVFVALALVVQMLAPAAAYAAGTYTDPDGNVYTYIIDGDGKATITDFTLEDPGLPDITIPEAFNGHPVTKIGTHAFYGNGLASVVIPGSVQIIGQEAFASNYISMLVIPSGVTSIESMAFAENDIVSLEIPGNVASIGTYAFSTNILTSLTIRDGVAEIGAWAFECNLLTSVTIPASVTSIGQGAFFTNQLTDATIYNSTANIGDNVFNDNQLNPEDLTIHGYTGSTAQSYADAKGHSFTALGGGSGDFGGGTGAALDPYIILSEAHLQEMAAKVNDPTTNAAYGPAYYMLTANITMTPPAPDESNHTPIGTADNPFTGYFDGRDYTISGLVFKHSVTAGENFGLFGYVGTGGVVRNTLVTSSSIEGNLHVGGMAGYNAGMITGCSFDGSVKGYASNVGGIAGRNAGEVSNSGFSGSVSSPSFAVGGIAGYNAGTVETVSFAGSVTGLRFVGGIAGDNSGEINSGNNDGDVTGSNYAFGGVAGRNQPVGIIRNSGNYGAVHGPDTVGGVAGENNGLIEYSHNKGNVSGLDSHNDFVGGIAGGSYGGTIQYCYNQGAVSGESYVGGLAGENGVEITDSFNLGAVTGVNYVGGLAGGSYDGSITRSYAVGAVTGTNHVGGLVGVNWNDATAITSSHYDSETTGRSDTGKGEPKTTAEMKTQATFADWDFADTWAIVNTATHWSYPYLQWFGYYDETEAPGYGLKPQSGGGYSEYHGADGNTYYFVDNGDGTATIAGLDDSGDYSTDLTIPDTVNGLTVTKIGENAFMGIGLTGVTIPAGVTSIGDDAFAGNQDPASGLTIFGYAGSAAQTYANAGGHTFAAVLAGDGSENDPYLVSSAANLVWISLTNNANNGFEDKYFKQTADIDMSGITNFIPIGDLSNNFKGRYDGHGHKILNLTVDVTTEMAGLFGVIGITGEVKGLTLENVSINIASNGDASAGGIAGANMGKILDCHIKVSGGADSSISAGGTGSVSIGGIAGFNMGSISQSSNAAEIRLLSAADGFTGGIAGGDDSGSIDNCFNTGKINNAGGNYTILASGGILGWSLSTTGITASYCISTGEISVADSGISIVGGIQGLTKTDNIENCFFLAGTAAAGYNILAGDMQFVPSSVGAAAKTLAELKTPSIFTGWDTEIWVLASGSLPRLKSQTLAHTVQPDGDGTESSPYLIESAGNLVWMSEENEAAGGFAGKHFKLTEDIDLSTVLGYKPIGNVFSAFKGKFDGNNRTISNMKVGDSEDPASFSYTGLFGYVFQGEIKGLTLEDVEIYCASSNAGGLVGRIAGGLISNVRVNGAITNTSSGGSAGGLIGTIGMENSAGETKVEDSSSDVEVFSAGDAGGFVGRVESEEATIDTCVSTGNVTGGDNGKIGGFAGGNMGTILNSSASGDATGGNGGLTYVGGFAGENGGLPLTIKNSFARGNVTGGEDAKVGGFVGFNNKRVLNAYATGNVTGGTNAVLGGFAAENWDEGELINTYHNSTVFTDAVGQGGGKRTSSDGITQVNMTAAANQPGALVDILNANRGSNPDWLQWTIMPGANDNYPVFGISTPPLPTPGSGSESGSGSTPAPTPGIPIMVNGQTQQQAAIASTQNQDGKTVTIVTLDTQKTVTLVNANSIGSTVTIPINNAAADVASVQLSGDLVKAMESREAVIEIKTNNASYTLPAQQINIEAVLAQLGQDVKLSDVKLNIEIAETTGEMARIVEDTASKGNFTIVVPPLSFNVKATYGDKTLDVSKFNSYVERTVAIPDGVDPSKITTGIVVEPDGTVRHVPTQIIIIDGKYYAKINSLTNSTYSVIWNPMEFSDVESHWAKEAVNDMGSRMVVSGVGNDMFAPDRDITRAEFAAIIVRALGLKPGTGGNPFADVSNTAWYCDYIKTAVEYKTISGYGDGRFGPSDKITREQAMAIASRAMNITGLKVEFANGEMDKLLAGFADAVNAADYARNSIAACIKTGIVSGNNDMIAPKDNITRAEVAVIVQRLLQKSGLI
jgi:hypothetical protein